MSIRPSSRWRLVFALAAIGIVVVVAAAVLGLWEDTPAGAATPEQAVSLYVDALNENNTEALRQLSSTPGPHLDAAIAQRLGEYGGRAIQLRGRDVEEGPAPRQASALLVGVFSDSQPYRERLFMNRGDNDRWYVHLQDVPTA